MTNDRSHAFGKEAYSFLDNIIFALRKRQVIIRLPKKPKVIADFGSGYDCRLLRSLQDKYTDANMMAIDTEFDASLAAEERLSFVSADLNQPLPLEDNSIDVALSLAVLEHLNRPDIFLREVCRVLKPEGVLLLTTPGPTSKPLLEFLAFKLCVIDAHEILDHKHYFSSQELRNELTSAGFNPENINAQTFIFGMNNVVYAIK